LIRVHFYWAHAFTASEVVTGKRLGTFAIPHCLLSNQFEVGVAVNFAHANGAVFLGVDIARLLMKLHISACLGPLVGVSSVVGKGAHGSIQLGRLWNFAVGFEHADVQTRATSWGSFLGLLHSRDVVFSGDSKWAINNPGRFLGMLQKELGPSWGSWWWLIGTSQNRIFGLLIPHVAKDLVERRNPECCVLRCPNFGFIDWEKCLIDALLCVVHSTRVEHTGNLLGFQLAGDYLGHSAHFPGSFILLNPVPVLSKKGINEGYSGLTVTFLGYSVGFPGSPEFGFELLHVHKGHGCGYLSSLLLLLDPSRAHAHPLALSDN